MAVSQLGIAANITWALTRAVTGFTEAAYGPETAYFAATSLDTGDWNGVFAQQYTITASGTQAVDFRDFTDQAGNTISADKILAVLVLVTGAAADVLNVKKHGTNGLQWFFENASYGVNVPGGGMVLFSEGESSAGTTVDASNKQWLLTNNGSASLTVKLVAITSDV